MLHVMLRPSLRTQRVLKEPHPLLVHRVVINRLSGRDERLSQLRPPADDHVEQESMGCQLTHRVTNAGPAQELERDPCSNALPVLIGERPYPCRYFSDAPGRERCLPTTVPGGDHPRPDPRRFRPRLRGTARQPRQRRFSRSNFHHPSPPGSGLRFLTGVTGAERQDRNARSIGYAGPLVGRGGERNLCLLLPPGLHALNLSSGGSS
jgi:hypothetical protein